MPISAEKATKQDSLDADSVLEAIYEENKSHWPHGLYREQFDGGLYLIKKESGDTVGFVGWQEREENGKNIGYYSVGILPEFRRKSFASQAVKTILEEKSDSVDEVRALVVSGNKPSKSLAGKLGVVVVEKSAGWKGTSLVSLLGGAGTMLMQDNRMHPDDPMGIQAFRVAENDKTRNLTNLTNFVLGATGAASLKKGLGLMKGTVGPAAKGKTIEALSAEANLGKAYATGGLAEMVIAPVGLDAMIDSHRASRGIERLSKDLPAQMAGVANATRDAKTEAFKLPKSLVYGGLGIGAAGLGIAGLMAALRYKSEKDKLEESRRGKLKVTLPTKDPGDSETTIELPTDKFDFSAALQDKLRRDARSRLLRETRQRTKRRKPVDPNNLTDAEKEILALDAEQEELDREMFGKAASLLNGIFKSAAAQPMVPTPPMPGDNPAMRMAQQAASAKQVAQGAATEANPQILQANQAASAAQQQAQQEVGAAQQQMQQEASERDQQVQSELASKDQEVFQARQEVEIQKTQAEKARVEMELAKAKMQAAQEIDSLRSDAKKDVEDSDSKAVKEIMSKRMDRVRSRLSKKSFYQPSTDFGVPSIPPPANNAPPVSPMDVKIPEIPPVKPPAGTPDSPRKLLRPNELQHINNNGSAFQAQGGVLMPHEYRVHYGSLANEAYEKFVKPFFFAPPRDTYAETFYSQSASPYNQDFSMMDTLRRAAMTAAFSPVEA